MIHPLTYIVSLAGASCLGLGFVLQQHAAATAPASDFLRFRLLLDLLHKPIWVLGILSMIVGQILSAVALALADVSLVEPLLTANLFFALIIARLLYHQPLGPAEWFGALLLPAGVAAFIVAGSPSGGNPDEDSILRWMLAIGMLLLAQLLVALARRPAAAAEARPMLLAGAAGLLFGIQDSLTRRAGHAFSHGIGGVFLSWAPYALIAIGVVSMVLAQSAFEAGRLSTTLPAITAAEPLSGIAVGVVVFGEHLHVDPLALSGEVAGLVAMVGGVLLVGTSRTFRHIEDRADAKKNGEASASPERHREPRRARASVRGPASKPTVPRRTTRWLAQRTGAIRSARHDPPHRRAS